jgi:hypothetical protein
MCRRLNVAESGLGYLHMRLAYTPDQIAAFWSGVGAIATVIAAGIAVLTLLAIRRDSRDRSRPVMVADIRPVALSKRTCELVVENVGQSVAKSVRVTFDPPLPDLNGAEAAGKVTPYLRRRYENAIPTMPPGRKLFNIYGVQAPGPDGVLVNNEPTPEDVTVTFEYEDTHGRPYKDSYKLSLRTLSNQTESFPSNADDDGMRRREVTALEAIARTLHRN